MCWQARVIKDRYRQNAQEDIHVVKIVKRVGDKFFSPYRNFEYHIGEISAAYIVKTEYNFGMVIEEGLHSYEGDSKIVYNDNRQPIITTSNKSFLGCWTLNKMVILDCIIPKGADYYVNSDGEYVSNRLIPTGTREILPYGNQENNEKEEKTTWWNKLMKLIG